MDATIIIFIAFNTPLRSLGFGAPLLVMFSVVYLTVVLSFAALANSVLAAVWKLYGSAMSWWRTGAKIVVDGGCRRGPVCSPFVLWLQPRSVGRARHAVSPACPGVSASSARSVVGWGISARFRHSSWRRRSAAQVGNRGVRGPEAGGRYGTTSRSSR